MVKIMAKDKKGGVALSDDDLSGASGGGIRKVRNLFWGGSSRSLYDAYIVIDDDTGEQHDGVWLFCKEGAVNRAKELGLSTEEVQ